MVEAGGERPVLGCPAACGASTRDDNRLVAVLGEEPAERGRALHARAADRRVVVGEHQHSPPCTRHAGTEAGSRGPNDRTMRAGAPTATE